MDIKAIIKTSLETRIANEIDDDPRGCMMWLYEPERPDSLSENFKK